MTQKIWKFSLQLADHQEVGIPYPTQILSVGLDPAGQLCLGAMVHPEREPVLTAVRIIGTGHPMPDMDGWRFVGSVVHGSFVWHVFAEGA